MEFLNPAAAGCHRRASQCSSNSSLSGQSASASPMAIPANYFGETVECSGFLLQVSLYIEMQSQKSSSERTKVAFLISLLTGWALLWARAIWNSQTTTINSFDAFSYHFKDVFCLPTGSLSIFNQFIHLGSLGSYYLYPTTANGTTTPLPTSFHFSTHPCGLGILKQF